MVDIWSSGITLYAMLCGCLPFDEESKTALYEKILACKFPIPKYISSSGADLLKKILIREVKKRISAKEILNHPWCKRYLQFSHNIEFTEDSIEPDILKKVSKLMYIPENSLKNMLIDNNHNEYTTLYYLLSKQKDRRITEDDSDKAVRFENKPVEIKPLDLSVTNKRHPKEVSQLQSDDSRNMKSPTKKLSRKASQTKGHEKPPLSSKRRQLSKDGAPVGMFLKPKNMDVKDITVELKEKITFSAKKSMDSKRNKSKGERSGSGRRKSSNKIGGVKM